MKIQESQNAVLTNFEVLQFLQERKTQKDGQKKQPGNMTSVTKNVFEYLSEKPSPLSQQPTLYSSEAIQDVVQQLARYNLTKGEVAMIINNRPETLPSLHCCIEEIEERLDEDQQQAVLDTITRILGCHPPAEDDEDENGNGAQEDEEMVEGEDATTQP